MAWVCYGSNSAEIPHFVKFKHVFIFELIKLDNTVNKQEPLDRF